MRLSEHCQVDTGGHCVGVLVSFVALFTSCQLSSNLSDAFTILLVCSNILRWANYPKQSLFTVQFKPSSKCSQKRFALLKSLQNVGDLSLGYRRPARQDLLLLVLGQSLLLLVSLGRAAAAAPYPIHPPDPILGAEAEEDDRVGYERDVSGPD